MSVHLEEERGTVTGETIAETIGATTAGATIGGREEIGLTECLPRFIWVSR
jgi:hypothetical protein